MSRIKSSSIISVGVTSANTIRWASVLGVLTGMAGSMTHCRAKSAPAWRGRSLGMMLCVVAVCLAAAQGAHAFDPPHYDAANGSDDCLRCHMLHGAPGGSLTAVAGNANLCESCHMAGGSAAGKPFADADQACPRVGLASGQTASGTSHRWDSGPGGHAEAVGAVTSTGTLTPGGALTGHYAKTYTITITTGGNVGVAAFSWTDTLGGSGTGLVTGTDVALNEGITLTFTDGTPAPSFALNDKWQIAVRPDIAAPLDATLANHLEKGLMMCSTCHDQHEQGLAPFDPTAPAYTGAGSGEGRHYQRTANNINQMCVDCHRARNVTHASDGSHPVGVAVPGGEFKAPTNLPLDATGKVVCLTCHEPHYATSTDGSLLRVGDANSLCTDCHTNCNTTTAAHFSPTSGVLWPGGQYGSTFPQITDTSKKGTCVNCHQPHGWPDNLAPATDFAKLLVERTNNDPQGDETLCYTCHDADGPSTKNVKDEYAETIHHPVKTSEQVPGREVGCPSCHNVHKAQSGAHDYNATADANRHNVPNPLQGAPGLAVDFTGVGNFLPVPANHFTPITKATGATYEYQVCLQCHTANSFPTTSAGTVTLTNGDTNVVGSGTAWTSALVGSTLFHTGDTAFYIVTAVTDATHLRLNNAYSGTTASGASYSIQTPGPRLTALYEAATSGKGANFTANSRIVTGTGTAWTSNLVGSLMWRQGDLQEYVIDSVQSATTLTLEVPYAGATGSAARYSIWAPSDSTTYTELANTATFTNASTQVTSGGTPVTFNVGAVALANGSENVAGTGTAWNESVVGGLFQRLGDSAVYRVTAFNSPTSISISPVYAGASISNQGFTITTTTPYATGTVDVTNGSTSITGTGTAWTAGLVGGLVQIGDGSTTVYTVTAVSGGTSLSITPAYAGATASGLSYSIPVGVYSMGTADFTNGSTALTGNGTLWVPGHVGALIQRTGETAVYRISAFTDSSHVTIAPAYAGTTGAAAQFTLAPMSYSTGTVAVTSGGATVTGTGTTFAATHVGGLFVVAGDTTAYTVTAFTNATTITISPVYGGATASGLGFTISNKTYNTGTAAVTNGSATVTGTGTTWTTSYVGSLFQRTGDSQVYTVVARPSATSITISPAYAGTTASGAYTLTAWQFTPGTVAVTNGSATVTGTGTTFALGMVGGLFQRAGDTTAYTITAFTSATSITISPAYGGTTGSTLAYAIVPGFINGGTAVCTNGSTTVTGTGTVWNAMVVGGAFQMVGDPNVYTIVNWTDATHLVIYPAYVGAASGSCTLTMGVYSLGTAAFTNGSTTVTGTGATWTAPLLGGAIQLNGDPVAYTIAGVADATHLTLDRPYAGTTAAGAYTINSGRSDILSAGSQATYGAEPFCKIYNTGTATFTNGSATVTGAGTTASTYATGTVAVTNGSATVTGTGTVWVAAHVGGRFLVTGDSTLYTVTALGSGTSITISPAYAGATASGKAYTINYGATIWSMMLAGGTIQRVGDTTSYTVVDVPSATSMTIAPKFTGTSGPGLYTVKFGTKAGMWIRANSETETYKVASVENPTTLTITPAYAGSATPNQAYALTAATDLSQEFNPNNLSGHPIVTSLNNFPNSLAPKALLATQMKAPWDVNVGNQTMMCSDCHNTDAVGAGAAQGPHGSAAQFMLRGANSANWPNIPLQDFDESWCANCHEEGVNGGHEDSPHKGWPCYYCHIVIPHGGKVSRLIATQTPGMPARYAYNNDLSNVHVVLFTKAAEGGYAGGSCKVTGNQGAHSGTATGEKW